mgnify:FL=1
MASKEDKNRWINRELTLPGIDENNSPKTGKKDLYGSSDKLKIRPRAGYKYYPFSIKESLEKFYTNKFKEPLPEARGLRRKTDWHDPIDSYLHPLEVNPSLEKTRPLSAKELAELRIPQHLSITPQEYMELKRKLHSDSLQKPKDLLRELEINELGSKILNCSIPAKTPVQRSLEAEGYRLIATARYTYSEDGKLSIDGIPTGLESRLHELRFVDMSQISLELRPGLVVGIYQKPDKE